MSFPRTEVEGVSLPRMLVGINWFMGFSHQTGAKDRLIREYQTREKLADIIEVFARAGVDAVYGVVDEWQMLLDAVKDAEDRTGGKITTITVPTLEVAGTQEAADANARILDSHAATGATFCLPHQASTDALLDRRTRSIPGMDEICKMIRERGMIPGLSTHMPETPVYADETGLDVATYIQIYNAAGFLMQIEVDWIHNAIQNAAKPVICIKPLAAGRLHPLVGMAFVWATIRDCDMVCVGTMTPDEAKELIDLSLSLLAHRGSDLDLQRTRSKASVTPKPHA
jgi:hypothetical protein